MILIDTHAHIYLPEFEKDRGSGIAKAKDVGVNRVIMPAIDSTTHQLMLQVEQEFDNCRAMMGVHPCSVNEMYERELAIVKEYLTQRSFTAIGEIGLDFYWDKSFMEQQYDAFERQCQWALEQKLPIVIHSRNAIDECIAVVKKYNGIKGIFHCFSGTVDQAVEIIDLGFLLGIGGVITYKNAGLDKVIEKIGFESLVLETDAPYLAPVPYRGKRNECSYLPLVAEKIAAVCNRNVEEIANTTTQNAMKLFNLI